MPIRHLVSNLLTNFTFGQQVAAQSIHVTVDLYKNADFIYM
jgi:hypothetical protein